MMNRAPLLRLCSWLLLLFVAGSDTGLAAGITPVGSWRTFDDLDGAESGAVTIFEQGGLLYGNVSKIFDPAKAGAVCSACNNDRKGQPIIGLQIIRGMRADGGDVWDGGQILDPKNGTIYNCSMRLEADGQKLLVRGYIGMSLIGRTQIWLRQ